TSIHGIAPHKEGQGQVGVSNARPSAEESKMDEIKKDVAQCVKDYQNSEGEMSNEERDKAMLDCSAMSVYTNVEEHHPYALINFRIRGEAGIGEEGLDMENAKVGGEPSFDVIIPFEVNDKNTVLVQFGADVYLHFSDLFKQGEEFSYDMDNVSAKFSGGLVYRVAIGKNGVVGINAFYDYQTPTGHHQVGGGIDIYDGYNFLSLNYYHPLSGWINMNGYREERASGGFDIRYERLLGEVVSFYIDGELSFIGHDFTVFNDPVANEASQAAVGLGFGINFDCDTKLTIGADVRKNDLYFDDINLNDLDLGLDLSLRHRMNHHVRKDCYGKRDRTRAVERARKIKLFDREIE
ncbi:MAG: inverse autotransporter beta domain-containing protein, partial [Halobacteriovoraceae bacterium]|nr:inverse autotransporter beta domain-containing protein [Halobacteriovoraceae bacterium]